MQIQILQTSLEPRFLLGNAHRKAKIKVNATISNINTKITLFASGLR